ncbi:putative transcriptional regulator [[Actinomadura] parvosata subsp. kistnae]|uniref:DUF5937 domain-containing protein n=1 Tax=[Actinomadura] parvosata subsp. kistnae TaxID=1909395 RepID=A0A1U9ZZF2_9ACTN|nr:hypothetical protein BKM31_19295 [Nonomuraea sp. ATCC 55076]SPL99022.1 putative transcriptional regulator [Actinomadura parvosata subsp. kistnae]
MARARRLRTYSFPGSAHRARRQPCGGQDRGGGPQGGVHPGELAQHAAQAGADRERAGEQEAHGGAYTRFAISPLWEAVAGARLIKQPHPLYGPWLDEVRPRLHGIRWELLDALIPPRGLPAFLAPPPAVAVPDLDLELATLRATPPETLATDLAWLPPSPATALLRDDPDRGLALLADQIAAFWKTALAPYWPKIRALLEGDLLYRARQLADGGAHRLLNTLDPTVEWSEDTLRVQHRYCTALRALRGRGLLLVPSAFTWPNVWSITTAPWQPTLRYGTRGIATLWERRSASVPQAAV